MQLVTANLTNLGNFEIVCLVMGLISAVCFIFSGLFYPGKRILALSEAQFSISIASVTQLHNRITERMAKVFNTSNLHNNKESNTENNVRIGHESVVISKKV